MLDVAISYVIICWIAMAVVGIIKLLEIIETLFGDKE